VTQTVSANGTLNPVVLVSVGTQVSGTVKKLYVDFNDKVKKGQALLELDDALVSATERQSAASVANAQATLELAQANEARMKSVVRSGICLAPGVRSVPAGAEVCSGPTGTGAGAE
jgi:HlyD family secretion protein